MLPIYITSYITSCETSVSKVEVTKDIPLVTLTSLGSLWFKWTHQSSETAEYHCYCPNLNPNSLTVCMRAYLTQFGHHHDGIIMIIMMAGCI